MVSGQNQGGACATVANLARQVLWLPAKEKVKDEDEDDMDIDM